MNGKLSPKGRWLLGLILLWAVAVRVWYAVPELNAGRYWDERYGLENVHSLLIEGKIKPANGYHPSLSYLPQAAILAPFHFLYEGTGASWARVYRPAGFTPFAYLLCRLSQVALGLLSLLLVYLLGKRLAGPSAGPAVGVGAVAVLAVSHWHIRQSVIYKPDMLLLVTVELAVLSALWALEQPRLRRFLVAGGAVGLALASKFNGGPAALPLTVGALLYGGWRSPRRWGKLVAAGLVAAALFLLLNPFIVTDTNLYVKDFSRTLRDYERKGEAEGGDGRLSLLVHAGSSLVSRAFHGPWVGALALAGLVFLVVRAWMPPAGVPERRRLAIFLAFPVSYVALYIAVTTNPSAHNWLPLLPFTAVAAAALGLWAAQALAERLPWPVERWGSAAALLATVLLAAEPSRWVYVSVVPTTAELAAKHLERRLAPMGGRMVLFEEELSDFARDLSLRRVHGGSARAVMVEDLKALSREEATLADGAVLSLPRYEAGAGALFEGEEGSAARVLAPAPFRSRGEELVVLARPWRRTASAQVIGETERVDGARSVDLSLPEGWRQARAISLELRLPRLPRRAPRPVITLDGKPLELLPAARARFLGPRFRPPQSDEGVLTVSWSGPPACRRALLKIHFWERSGERSAEETAKGPVDPE